MLVKKAFQHEYIIVISNGNEEETQNNWSGPDKASCKRRSYDTEIESTETPSCEK